MLMTSSWRPLGSCGKGSGLRKNQDMIKMELSALLPRPLGNVLDVHRNDIHRNAKVETTQMSMNMFTLKFFSYIYILIFRVSHCSWSKLFLWSLSSCMLLPFQSVCIHVSEPSPNTKPFPTPQSSPNIPLSSRAQ